MPDVTYSGWDPEDGTASQSSTASTPHHHDHTNQDVLNMKDNKDTEENNDGISTSEPIPKAEPIPNVLVTSETPSTVLPQKTKISQKGSEEFNRENEVANKLYNTLKMDDPVGGVKHTNQQTINDHVSTVNNGIDVTKVPTVLAVPLTEDNEECEYF